MATLTGIRFSAPDPLNQKILTFLATLPEPWQEQLSNHGLTYVYRSVPGPHAGHYEDLSRQVWMQEKSLLLAVHETGHAIRSLCLNSERRLAWHNLCMVKRLVIEGQGSPSSAHDTNEYFANCTEWVFYRSRSWLRRVFRKAPLAEALALYRSFYVPLPNAGGE